MSLVLNKSSIPDEKINLSPSLFSVKLLHLSSTLYRSLSCDIAAMLAYQDNRILNRTFVQQYGLQLLCCFNPQWIEWKWSIDIKYMSFKSYYRSYRWYPNSRPPFASYRCPLKNMPWQNLNALLLMLKPQVHKKYTFWN